MKTHPFLTKMIVCILLLACMQPRGSKALAGNNSDDLLSFLSDSVPHENVYVESSGLLVIEVESTEATSGWNAENTLAGYSGSSYYTWRGNDFFHTPGHGILTHRFHIQQPGEYLLDLHNYNPCNDHTECNDVWVRMDYGPWVKAFSSTKKQWNWDTFHEFSSINIQQAKYNLGAGYHVVEISGRSKNFSIDRMVFHLADVEAQLWKNATESDFDMLADTIVPSAPGEIRIDKFHPDGYTFVWDPGDDNHLVKGYNFYRDSVKINESAFTETGFTINGLTHGLYYIFEVETVDWFENVSQRAAFSIHTNFNDTIPPTAPPFVIASTTDTTITLSWIAGTDNFGVIEGYNVYLNDDWVVFTPEPNHTLTGLASGTKYLVGIATIDAAGNESVRKEIFAITKGTPTNIEWNSDATGLEVYPNPATQAVYVETNNIFPASFSIVILDPLGRTIHSLDANSTNQPIPVDVNNLKTGIYILRVYNKDRAFSSIIIKE